MSPHPPPFLRQVVLDCPHPRALAEFYRELLGYVYRAGDEAPAPGEEDLHGHDWLVLHPADGGMQDGRGLAFQHTDDHLPSDWTPGPVTGQRRMLHLDLTVPDAEALVANRDRAVELGARILLDESEDPDERLYVFADPAGHPFCIFIS